MYDSSTLEVVRDAAQIFSGNGQVLTISNPEFPLAVFANGYTVDESPNKVAMSDDLAASVEDHFDEVNQDPTALVEEEHESITENIHIGLAKIQTNTTNVILPAINAMHTDYATRQGVSSQPDINVEPYRYDAVHDDPRLVNHVNTRYVRVRPMQEYRSFILSPVATDRIIEMVAVNNPHLDQEQVTEWLLKLQPATIDSVWQQLFGDTRAVQPNRLSFLQLGKAPFNVDEILLAYSLCGHYMENPEVVPNDDVDIDTWTHTLRLMHEMFGFYLYRAYLLRAEHREQNVLVLKYDSNRYIDNRRVHVIMNGDVADPWLASHGDVQALLGAAIDGGTATTIEAVMQRADFYTNRWIAVYPLIKQAALDYADAQRRRDLIGAFLSQVASTQLADRYTPDLRNQLDVAMRSVRNEDLNQPYRVFSQLITTVYFPEEIYAKYLESIDEYGEEFPNASLRELSTQGLITLVALFMSRQIKTENFIPDVDPNAVMEERDTSGTRQPLAMIIDEDESTDGVSDEVEVTDMSGGGSDDEFGGDASGSDLDDEEDPYDALNNTEEEPETDDSLEPVSEEVVETPEETEEEEEVPLA